MKNISKIFILILFVAQFTKAQTKRPNIIFAIADDMSHASAYGYKFLKTPHFDKIGKEGLL